MNKNNLIDNTSSLLSAAVGASVLTALHESSRQWISNSPHVHLVAMEAIQKSRKAMGLKGLSQKALYRSALWGDLISNSLYYAATVSMAWTLTRRPRSLWQRALLWGSVAGIGALVLPNVLGLRQQPSRNFQKTALMTFGFYLTGAFAAAASSSAFHRWLPRLSQQAA